jgi:hypothetical protein
MIRKSTLGAIAFIIAAIGLASPTFAAGASNDSPAATGGGSSGYNNKLRTDYRLKHHHVKHHNPSAAK